MVEIQQYFQQLCIFHLKSYERLREVLLIRVSNKNLFRNGRFFAPLSGRTLLASQNKLVIFKLISQYVAEQC